MYLIIGGSGFLGRYVIKNILQITNEKIAATFSSNLPKYTDERLTWERFDVCNIKAIQELKSKYANESIKIVYLAAYHHPDKVAENPQLAWENNVIALANFVNIFDNVQCFYYSSTDTVYGEGSIDYKFKESDDLNPVNLYGKHKVLAEQIVLTKGYNVVRFPFIIGTSLVENKKHFFDNILTDIKAGKTVEMFSDSYRSTLSFNQCSRYLIEIIEKYGNCDEKIINISGDDTLSKYDVALLMAEKYNLDTNLVKPISVKNASSIFKVKRATTAVLDNQKLKKLLNINEIKLEI